jgi:MFS family permease
LYAASLAGVVLVPSLPLAIVLLFLGGLAWVAILSEVNASLQLFLPGWVRARGLSVYQMVLFGSQGAGALFWGLVAEPVGLVTTFLIAAAILLAGALTIRVLPFADTTGMNRDVATPWPEHHLVLDTEQSEGPVVVSTTYTVSREREESFLEAIARLRRSRLRTGASRWGLYRDAEKPHRFVELFMVPSWEEHLRQAHERLTGADQELEEQVNAHSDPPPVTRHMLGVEVSERKALGRPPHR